MGRLSGYRFESVVAVVEDNGWILSRWRGSHVNFTKPGERSVLTIPRHREIAEGTLRSIIRTMGLSVDEFVARVRK